MEFLLSFFNKFSWVLNVFFTGHTGVHKKPFKVVSRPLDRMLDQIGEIFQSAQRNRFLWRILGVTVGLRDFWINHLGVAFGSQCAAL